MKKKLGVVSAATEGLGLLTIMDRALAQKHGVRYVHLAAFAIDVDRVRDEVETEALDPLWPFGFEVFLTEHWLLGHLDAEADEVLISDVCESVMKMSAAEPGQIFGAELPFAIYDAVVRGALPPDFRRFFRIWKHKPNALVDDLAALWAKSDEERPRLSAASLEVGKTLSPPLAPPTVVTLAAWCEARAND